MKIFEITRTVYLKQLKFRTIYGNRMVFQLVPRGFSDLKNLNVYNSNRKKLLGLRNVQEKLENIFVRDVDFLLYCLVSIFESET